VLSADEHTTVFNAIAVEARTRCVLDYQFGWSHQRYVGAELWNDLTIIARIKRDACAPGRLGESDSPQFLNGPFTADRLAAPRFQQVHCSHEGLNRREAVKRRHVHRLAIKCQLERHRWPPFRTRDH